MAFLSQRSLLARRILLGLCVLIVSGCAWNDAGEILYQSAISKQKFDCENDKVGNSIERCKRDIDASIEAAQASESKTHSAPETTGYEPKDFVKKQINRAERSTQ